MSSTYKVVAGDTFESIARKKYGTEQNANRIAIANPGVLEPLTAGTTLNIPLIPGLPQNLQQQADTANQNETAVLIDGKRFRFWDKVSITRSIDSMSTASFGTPSNVGNSKFRETFRPFSYPDMVVTVGGDPLFTGTMIGINPALDNGQKVLAASGYSLPGVLNDCTPPASSFPLEFNDLGLQEIIASMASPFGIGVDFQGDQGAIFERVASEPGKKVLAFLIDLEQQRNLIISDDPRGKLVVWQSVDAGNPVAQFEQGSTPLLSVTPTFNAQDYYSDLTGIESTIVGLQGSQFTVKNPLLSGVIRPFIFTVPDVVDSTIKAAVEAKTGRMFGNLVSYSIRVDTWRDPSGDLWEPNTTVTLLAPDAMIYTNYEFIIRSIEFEKDRTTETATLNLVLPGSDRKSTRLNSSHRCISYAVFCLKKKTQT